MTSRFMTDPHAMRDMAGRFEVHAQTVEDEARRMWASAQNISGAGWSGMAEATSLDTMTQMNQAFRNIVNMLHGVRDGLVRDANNYEQQEQASQQILGAVRRNVGARRRCYVWLCGCVGERVAVDSVRGAPKTTNSAGVVAQAVASVSWPNPNDWWLVRLLGSITPTERTTIVRLLGQSYLATGMARFLTSIAQQLTFGPGGTTAGSGGAWYPTPQFAGLGAGPAVSASLARAEPVGRLSVPPSWAVAAPAFAEKPEAGTPMSVIGEASSCGQGGLLRGIPLARAGRRTGAFAHRYGFRHSVITRSPSAG